MPAARGDENNTMNKKRSAPGSGSEPTAGSSTKKRKMDNLQKFYAVQAGHIPGVYLNYADCSRQTTGFKGAICTFELARQLSAHAATHTDRLSSQIIHVNGGCKGVCSRQEGFSAGR